MKYPNDYVWVLETQYGYYPSGTWGFAARLGGDETEARSRLARWDAAYPGEYRLINNQTDQVVHYPIEKGQDETLRA